MEKDSKRGVKKSKWKKVIGIFLVLIIALYLGYVFVGTQLKEEFTGQRFVVYTTSDFSGAGSITYYCRNGIFIHSPQRFEEAMMLTDAPYFKVHADEIYVNMTFMGSGATFPLKRTENYRMTINPDQEYSFCKNKERIKIIHHELIYYNLDTEEERKVRIEDDQYNDIKKIIKSMSLVPTNWDQEYAYIMWTRDDDTSETVYVDGAEEFDVIKEMYFE